MSTAPTRRRPLAAVAMVALAAMVIAACNPTQGAEDTNYAAVNAVRAAVAQPDLSRSAELNAKAKTQADRMAKRGKIYHSQSLSSGVPAGWRLIGENVASATSIEQAQAALEASPAHYANMTNPQFTEIGTGVSVRNGVYYVVQVYVGR